MTDGGEKFVEAWAKGRRKAELEQVVVEAGELKSPGQDELETQIRHVRETNAMLWGEVHKLEDLAKQLEAKIAQLESELERVWERRDR